MIENAFYSPEVQGDYELRGIGDFELEEGGTIPDLQLAVATYGTLNAARDNAILIPTWFSGTHQTWELVYIDVGAADLVANGEVKLAHGQVTRLTEDSVVLDDGTELPADLVVYATGYGSMNGWAADLINQEVADKVGKVWGLGSDTTKDPGPWEGEQRNMWKPTQQEALWFHGGNLHQSRHYSLYLALQLKARSVGVDTPVYGLQEVHHLR